MRFFFLLTVIANLAMLGWGLGFFGLPPSTQGSDPRPFQQSHETLVTLSKPLPTRQITP
jgi:hypothetical protein